MVRMILSIIIILARLFTKVDNAVTSLLLELYDFFSLFLYVEMVTGSRSTCELLLVSQYTVDRLAFSLQLGH